MQTQTTIERPADSTGAISPRSATPLAKRAKKRTGGSLRPVEQPTASNGPAMAELRRIRAEAEAAVERLLALLDQIDGYPDDEPSLGFIENHPKGFETRPYRFAYATDEGRQDIGQGADDDCEGDEHDGREPDCDSEDGGDDEPSLGWTGGEAARGRTYAGTLGESFDLEGEVL